MTFHYGGRRRNLLLNRRKRSKFDQLWLEKPYLFDVTSSDYSNFDRRKKSLSVSTAICDDQIRRDRRIKSPGVSPTQASVGAGKISPKRNWQFIS